MNKDVLLVLITILVALIFDFLNGFHDSANSIATVVSTRVLSPKLAVLWAAAFNFLAAFFLGTAVAKTIGKGMIRLDHVDQYVVMAGLFGAIVWDLLDLVVGTTHFFVSRPDRRLRRCRHDACRHPHRCCRPCSRSSSRKAGTRL